jgi:phospholipid transport system substrate-binding protein
MKCLRDVSNQLVVAGSLAIVSMHICGVFAQEAGSEHGGPAEDAVATVGTLQHALIEAAAVDNVDDRFALLLPAVRATHDLHTIARLTIRRDFDGFTPMAYAARFTGLTKESFRNTGSALLGNGRAEVESFIRTAKGEEVSLDYVLQDSPDGWRIINIVADGVSDLALKRAEYRAILESGNAADLVAAIEAQTASLRQD